MALHGVVIFSCDLLKNIYLCGINNNVIQISYIRIQVVICLKISTFVVSTTTQFRLGGLRVEL